MNSNVKIFIKSAGEGPTQDFSWAAHHPSDESFLSSIEAKSHAFGDNNATTMFISRVQASDLLLTLGSLPTGRTDPGGRRIRNSIAIHAPAQEEAQIRGIAVHYLKAPDTFAQMLDQNVVFDQSNEKFGWSADFEKIRNSLLECEPGRSDGPFQSAQRFGRYTPSTTANQLHEQLADELMHSPLPHASQSDVPVLIVRDASEKLFEENRVWRGLSDFVKHEGWQGKEVLHDATEAAAKAKNLNGSAKIAIVSGSVALAAALGGWLWHVKHRRDTAPETRAR